MEKCNFNLHVKGAMVDKDGNAESINKEMKGGSIIAIAIDDVTADTCSMSSCVWGVWNVMSYANVLRALRNAWGDREYMTAVTLCEIGLDNMEKTEDDRVSELVEEEIKKALSSVIADETEEDIGQE